MGITLAEVVPWGRSYAEYAAMFGLTGVDLDLRILGCGDGPADFNAELTRRGGRIVSVDPIYRFCADQIRSRIAETYHVIMAQVAENQEDFIWSTVASVQDLGRIRLAAMEGFLADFAKGKKEGRYLAGELPSLPLGSKQFDLALSSHFLFLYSAHFSAAFHFRALLELLRVSFEVRVFPLLALDGTLSPHLPVVSRHLQELGFQVERRRVPYEFQHGGNEMLVIKPA